MQHPQDWVPPQHPIDPARKGKKKPAKDADWKRKQLQRMNRRANREHHIGLNFCMLSGYVIRAPRSHRQEGKGSVWFTLFVPDPTSDQKLYVSVVVHGSQAIKVWENLAHADEVVVMGRLYSFAFIPRGEDELKRFSYIEAHRVSPRCPVQLDADPRYIRVRADLFSRVTSLLEITPDDQIPDNAKEELLAVLKKLEAGGGKLDGDQEPKST